MNIRENVIYYIKKNIFIVLVLIGLCPVLALSYAKFTINSESYRSNEMYISQLLYSIKIDDENTYTINVESGETEHTIEITSLNSVSTNYKLAYLNNAYIDAKYASDYLEPAFGGILTKRTIFLTIKNTSTEKQTLSLMVFGGYSFNDVEDVKVLDTYTEILDDYWKYDFETTALYVDNKRVDELDLSKHYKLKKYTCNNDATVEYDTLGKKIIIGSNKQTKCSLYFEESDSLATYLISDYQTLGLTKIDQTAFGNQNYDITEYRYQGKTPNNYISFNDEVGVWRIIGVFGVETPDGDGTYTKEYKVKLVRNVIGTLAWNSTKTGTNYSDWTTATLMTVLNSGSYYNRTGTYASNGLTDNARNQISSTKWYLGNVSYAGGSKDSKGTYQEERSKNIWSGNKETWDGKVALIYPSDYMYASSKCYNNGTIGYNYGNTTCTNTNWMLNTSSWFWTISPGTGYVNNPTFVESGSMGHSKYGVNNSYGSVRQALYLSSDIKYISGDGSSNNPFVIR